MSWLWRTGPESARLNGRKRLAFPAPSSPGGSRGSRSGCWRPSGSAGSTWRCCSFGGPILNIHPSLIPAFCGKGFYGLRVHRAALDYGVKVTGATVHLVNEVPDGGEILLQKAVDVLPGDTPEVLQRRVMEQAEWVLLPRAAELVAAEIVCKKEKLL